MRRGDASFYYDADSQIIVYGDTTPNLSFFDTKINNLKDSIDDGMPVIWWTTNGAGEFSNHYMNIFGYETWKAIDDNGNAQEHLMFKLRYNWGEQDIYMDSDVLNAVNGGFIFFEETRKHVSLIADDYGFPCSYNNNAESKTVYKFGIPVYTERLRTGYINHYNANVLDDQRLVLSSKRESYNEAYITWRFNEPIRSFVIGLTAWSSGEWISGEATIEILCSGNGGNKKEEIKQSSLSSSYYYPHSYHFTFDENQSVDEVTLTAKSLYVGNDRNKGRVVVSGISAVYQEIINPDYL